MGRPSNKQEKRAVNRREGRDRGGDQTNAAYGEGSRGLILVMPGPDGDASIEIREWDSLKAKRGEEGKGKSAEGGEKSETTRGRHWKSYIWGWFKLRASSEGDRWPI